MRNFKKTEKELTPDEILAKMEYFCAYQERSPREVQQKLKSLGPDPDVAVQVLQVLEADGYFNEERYAKAFAGGKFRIKNWGRVRIRQALQQQGISEALIADALGEIDEAAYLATFRKLRDNKAAQLAGDPNIRVKLSAYLVRAGYEFELVYSQV